MEYLMVKDFARFQHYRDRGPVWIKLYNAVMDDEAFLALSDAARGHLMLIWLLASRRDNKLPNDAKMVGRAIQSSGRVDLERLVVAGFLLPYQSASALLAEPEHDASATHEPATNGASPRVRPRARGEGEREEEKETPADAAPSRKRAKQEPAPWMGLMAGAWTLGTIPLGSATVLRPVVAAVGEAETARRLAVYCGVTDRRFASVRDFAAKHATFAEDDGPLVADGWFTPAGERATR